MAEASVRGGPELERYLAAEVGQVDAALGELLAAVDAAGSLADPIRYALGTRGKRIRPVLCVAAYRGITGRDEPDPAVYRLACAVEVVHTYSLVHDDLPCMDDDDLRRGRPTVHRVFGAGRAVLAGAALLPVAVRLLDSAAATLGLAPTVRGRLVGELCRAAGANGMVGGQFLDLEAEARTVEAAQLESIHRAKTGALLAAALRVGGLAAGADDARLAGLTAYGESLGLAFQITDDVLDVTLDSAALGKTAGKDSSVGKATYPALFGLAGARSLAAQRADEAVAALREAGIESPPLSALARFVVERQR